MNSKLIHVDVNSHHNFKPMRQKCAAQLSDMH